MSGPDGGSRADEKKTTRLRRDEPRPASPDSGLVPVNANILPEGELHLDTSDETRYVVRGTMGQGGMGEVRRCLDMRIGREVAMKIVHGRGRSTPPSIEQRQRFLREARIQGQLEHPAVVPVYDLGGSADEGLYFTMKRVRGATLQQILERLSMADEAALARYSRRKLLNAFCSVCLAVDYAHARGVVHRDLKPANIMLGDFGEVYILDWGLARISGVPETRRPATAERGDPTPIQDPMAGVRPTVHGEILGTPGYMSPEQANGLNDQLDGRADVYSLGVILFELLTHEPLHAPETDSTQVVADTLLGVTDRVTEGMRACQVPPELEAVCLRALQTAPQDRYASARELCEAVESYLDGDRDLELRRELAEGHAERACDMAAKTIALQNQGNPAIEPRCAALREVGRALALDPGHTGAMAALSSLLETPPRELPPGVVPERDTFARDEQRVLGRLGAYSYFSFFLYAPLALLGMGVRNWPIFLIGTVFWTLASFGHLWRYFHPRADGRVAPALVLLSSVSVFLLSSTLGSHLIMPTVAAVHGVTYLLGRDRSVRPLVWAASVLIILLPVLLELLGWWPEHYRFQDGVITIFPYALNFPPIWTRVFLVVVDLGMVLTACAMVAGMRDALSTAEQRMQLHAWQLRQLVPAEPSTGRSIRRVRRRMDSARRDRR
ncbi:MAG TPA: serine/threonine-protein kinase [Polyangia bacterium]|jgi:serine/threonine-protein kinase|nr:serine/threonine-protein kinase [Polyangia bacterium]